MSKFDFQYEKKIIGKLIGYYRKHDKRILEDFLWDVGHYYNEYCLNCTKCISKEKICAPKTLYKIESGAVVDNDCYYYRLSEKCNKKLILDKKLFLNLDDYRERLTNQLIDFSCTKLSLMKNMLEYELSLYTDYVYVSERLQLYINVINASLGLMKYNKKDLDFYYFIKDSFDEKDRMLILYLLYCVDESNDIDIRIYQEAISFQENRLSFRFLSTMAFKIYEPSQLFKVVEEYKNKYINQFTKHEWYMYNNLYAYVYINTGELKLCRQFLQKNVELLELGLDYSEKSKRNLLNRLAVLSYNQKNYKETVYYYSKCFINGKINIGNANIAFYIDSLEKLNEIDKVLDIIRSYDINKLSIGHETKIIRYYRIKYLNDLDDKERLKKREDFICEELIDLINAHGTLLKNLMKEELMSCVEQTTNYKKVYLFEKLTVNK